MFTVDFDKVFAPWSLGQGRTLGRALDNTSTERIWEQWQRGDFARDPYSEAVFQQRAGLHHELTDLWGPRLLAAAWSGKFRLSDTRLPARALELTTRNLLLQMRVLPAGSVVPSEARRVMEELQGDPRLRTLLELSYHLKRVIEMSFPSRCQVKLRRDPRLLRTVRERYAEYVIPGVQIKFIFTGGPIIVEYQGQNYVSSHDHLLCYAGKVDTLATYAAFLPWAGVTYLTSNDSGYLIDLVEFLQLEHVRRGQKFFECAKVLDGLCQAYFLMRPEVDGPANRLMLDQIKADVADDPALSEFVADASTFLGAMTAAALIEASSIGKCSGHPTVDVESGLRQLRDRTNNARDISRAAVVESVRALKRQYCVNQIRKNKSWPPLLPGASQRILQLVATDALPEGPQAAAQNVVLTPEDWDTIDFAPTKQLQPLTSILPYIKDKTISLDRDDSFSTYLHDGLTTLYTQKEALTPQEVYERTALVLYVLLTRNLGDSFSAFLNRLVASPVTDLSDVLTYLIIKVVPKEGELKTNARLFGEKSFNYRLHSILQEITAASFLAETFPRDQAMTSGELELKKRLYELTTLPVPAPGYEYIHLVTDVSGWNNGFRHESVAPLGKVLDQIHGTSVFEKTHRLYEHTVVVNKGPDTLRGWEGQLGGIEGLNQDTWVIVYLSQMHAIFSKLQYRYHFMDMGDNFIVKLAVPTTELDEAGGPAKFAMRLSQQLALEIRLYGHDAKPDESTCSQHAFIFCHQYRVRGVQIPAHLRKAAKMSGSNDAFFPFLDSYIGCAYSNAHAMAEQGVLAVGSYYCALAWSYTHILSSRWAIGARRRPVRYRDLDDDTLVALLLIPNVLGGFPILYLETMFLRSEADHLPQCVRMAQEISKFDKSVSSVLWLAIRQPRDSDASLLTLLSDPRSLALTRPSGPVAVLTTELDGRLARVAKNEELVQLYETYDEEAQEALVRSLAHNTVWPARLLGAIYGSSGFAARKAIASCFESSRTAIAFLLHTKPHRMSTPVLCRRALLAEQRYHQWRYGLLSGDHGLLTLDCLACPTLIAHSLRRTHWGREVTTITTPPMGHLFELLEGAVVPPSETYLQIRVAAPIDRVGNVSDHLSRGPFEPFLGHSTSSATRTHVEILRSKDLLVDSVLNLALSRSWAKLIDEDGSVVSLIDDLLGAFTSLNPLELQILSGERSHGTIEHHLRGRGFNPTIAPNSQTSWLSLLTYDTRQAAAFQKGQKYAVNFLEEVLFAEYLLLGELQTGRRCTRLDTTWILRLKKCECFTPIENRKITARQVCGRGLLRSSVLPKETRDQLTDGLQIAIREAGYLGVFSREVPVTTGAALGLLLAYWAQLSCAIESVAATESSDAFSWRSLAYLQGTRLPKELSLNIMRRLPPITLSRALVILNHVNVICEARRAAQIQPTGDSCHSPGTTALIHICRIASEGALLGPLYAALGRVPEYLLANTPALYQVVWRMVATREDANLIRSIWLDASVDFHSFIRVLRMAVLVVHLDVVPRYGAVDHVALRGLHQQWEVEGYVSVRSGLAAAMLGILGFDGQSMLLFHRANPAVLHDTARKGQTFYSIPPRLIPPTTPREWIDLEGFGNALRFRAALRAREDVNLALQWLQLDQDLLWVWRSTTKSPSRFIYAACRIKLSLPFGVKIACVGDGLGGISHLLASVHRRQTLFYSTLFVGPAGEQPPGALAGPGATISDEYMRRNLRDVTRTGWADAFRADDGLRPNLLVNDAELVDEEDIYAMIRALGEVIVAFPDTLLMLRVRHERSVVTQRAAALATRYADQVQYVQVPANSYDGYLVLRYGRDPTPPEYCTQEASTLLGEDIAPDVSMSQCIGWCVDHLALHFPLRAPCEQIGLTGYHLNDRAAGSRLLVAQVARMIDTRGPADLAGLVGILPLVVAFDIDDAYMDRIALLVPDRLEDLATCGEAVIRVLRELVVRGLMIGDNNVDAAEDDLNDI